MYKVTTMKQDVKELSVLHWIPLIILQQEVSTFHDDVGYSGLKQKYVVFLIFRALKEAERYISLQTTKDQVDKAYEDIIVFDNLVTLVERVNELVYLVTVLLLLGQ